MKHLHKLILVGALVATPSFAKAPQFRDIGQSFAPYCDELDPEDIRLVTGECLISEHPRFPDPDPTPPQSG